jgi:hypothetical protein
MRFKPSCIEQQKRSPEKVGDRDIDIREFGSPEDESLGTRHQKSRRGEIRSEPFIWEWTRVARSPISGIQTSGFREGSP